MYLTAHRIISLSTREEGVNAFYHTHGANWAGVDADPAEVPNTLIAERRDISTDANRIRSYLDVVAPDASSPKELIVEFESFLLGEPPEQFPCLYRGEVSAIRMGVERALAASWRAEAQLLFYECLHVWMGQTLARVHPDQGAARA